MKTPGGAERGRRPILPSDARAWSSRATAARRDRSGDRGTQTLPVPLRGLTDRRPRKRLTPASARERRLEAFVGSGHPAVPAAPVRRRVRTVRRNRPDNGRVTKGGAKECCYHSRRRRRKGSCVRGLPLPRAGFAVAGLSESEVEIVGGAGAEMSLNKACPDTKQPIVGALIPKWEALTRLVISAAEILPGISTQSWDVALAAEGPVLLEVNYGGDLNLAQLAYGAGVREERYTEHLARCGYRSRVLREAMGESSHKSRPVISTFPSSVS